MLFNLNPRKIDTFELFIQDDIIVMKGDMYISQEAILELAGFLKEAHKLALETDRKTVVLDVRDLVFLNSSGLREILQWINMVSALPPEKSYKVKFILDKHKSWQTVMLDNLKLFSANIVAEFSGKDS